MKLLIDMGEVQGISDIRSAVTCINKIINIFSEICSSHDIHILVNGNKEHIFDIRNCLTEKVGRKNIHSWYYPQPVEDNLLIAKNIYSTYVNSLNVDAVLIPIPHVSNTNFKPVFDLDGLDKKIVKSIFFLSNFISLNAEIESFIRDVDILLSFNPIVNRSFEGCITEKTVIIGMREDCDLVILKSKIIEVIQRIDKIIISRECFSGNKTTFGNLVQTIVLSMKPNQRLDLAQSLALTFDQAITPQFFIDIGSMAKVDAGTGIQRVVKNVTRALLDNPPEEYEVKPIYFDEKAQCFRYAQDWTLRNFNRLICGEPLSPIDYSSKDIYLGLDLGLDQVPLAIESLQKMQRHGVLVGFNVYDIIPILNPEFFPKETQQNFPGWINIVSTFDFLLFNTSSTLDRYKEWKLNYKQLTKNNPRLGFYHLGSDILSSLPTSGLPQNCDEILKALRKRPSFLVVSTIEPRKGYDQLLLAFDELNGRKIECNFIFVGRRGWDVDRLIHKIQSHIKFGERLFWLEGISDEFLNLIYKHSTCVINASRAEGFGLSLIEAAHHKKPLILRDIPEFREIAQKNAFYFAGFSGKDLADAIQIWLRRFNDNPEDDIFKSTCMKCLNWNESARMLINALKAMKAF